MPWINLSRLSPARKRRAWAWLRAQRPAHAAWLASAPVREFIDSTEGEVLVEIGPARSPGIDTRVPK